MGIWGGQGGTYGDGAPTCSCSRPRAVVAMAELRKAPGRPPNSSSCSGLGRVEGSAATSWEKGASRGRGTWGAGGERGVRAMGIGGRVRGMGGVGLWGEGMGVVGGFVGMGGVGLWGEGMGVVGGWGMKVFGGCL